MTVEVIGDGNTDGTVFGQSGEKIAFFGGTPAIKVTLTSLASSATIATTNAVLKELIDEMTSKSFIGG